jgi:hypothetical protein
LRGGAGELPGRMRLAAFACVLLTGLCGLLSAWEGFSLLRFSELKQAQPAFKLAADPFDAEQLRASLTALEHMREPRLVVLFALAMACSLSFVASTRLLRPAGLPREGVRRILVWALVVAAVFRTVDGAQSAVVAKSAAEVVRRGLKLPAGLSEAAAEELRGFMASAALLVAPLWTAVVAGSFILLSQYFRSARVKEWVARADTGSA